MRAVGCGRDILQHARADLPIGKKQRFFFLKYANAVHVGDTHGMFDQHGGPELPVGEFPPVEGWATRRKTAVLNSLKDGDDLPGYMTAKWTWTLVGV
jgi:hypothetical protein